MNPTVKKNNQYVKINTFKIDKKINNKKLCFYNFSSRKGLMYVKGK